MADDHQTQTNDIFYKLLLYLWLICVDFIYIASLAQKDFAWTKSKPTSTITRNPEIFTSLTDCEFWSHLWAPNESRFSGKSSFLKPDKNCYLLNGKGAC